MEVLSLVFEDITIGMLEIFVMFDVLLSFLTFLFLLLHGRRTAYLFNWILDYLMKLTKTEITPTKGVGCPKCSKPILSHNLMEAKEHGIMNEFTEEMRKVVVGKKS